MSIKPVAWTPGPWYVRGREIRTVNARGIGEPIATAIRDDKSPDALEANASLIASAPELAEALEILTSACEKEFISPVTERDLPCADDYSVMGGLDGESPITFGMIRAARKLLARITPK